MARRSTRHAVIGGLTVAYGVVLVLVWGSVIVTVLGIRIPIPAWVWAVLGALSSVPVLLLVTGSRLCRVPEGARPRFLGLIADTPGASAGSANSAFHGG